MKAILLAAGVGSRLSRKIDRPKSLLEVGDTTIIRHTAEMLLKEGIEIAVVAGYKKDLLYENLKGLDVKLYYNPFFKVTNSMASLWFARDFFDDKNDMILGNADVFWEKNLLDKLTADPRDAVMLSDVSRVKVGDYFFKTVDDRIVLYGKDIPPEERTSEYVGVAKLRKHFIPGFVNRLEKLVEDEVYHLWWENVLYEHSKQYPVYALDVDGMFWGEVDYIEDYERIVNYLESKKEEKH